MTIPVSAVGIPWYAREDYRAILEVMTDADKLPKTFEAWRERAEELERQIKSRGHIVVRAAIKPQEFSAWCIARGLNVDANARNLFAAGVARDAVADE